MKLESGEIITLEDNKEYICFATVTYETEQYVYLISNFKPLEIRFAKQKLMDNSIELEIINNQEQKKKLLKLFQSNN